MNFKALIGILALTVMTPAMALGQSIDYYYHTPNAAISGSNNKTLSGKSVDDCKKACTNEKSFVCRSFDYAKATRKCDLSSESEQTKTLKTNYSGNPYDHYSRYTFIRTDNAAISGHNNKTLTGKKASECQKACIEETGFRCKSFDYDKKARKCDLSSKSAFDAGGLKTDYPGNPYAHYSLRTIVSRTPAPQRTVAPRPAPNILGISETKAFVMGSAEQTIRNPLGGSFKTEKCGLEADRDAGTPDTIGQFEHVAKWDCNREFGSTLFRRGNALYTKKGGETCGLQYDADAGEVSGAFKDAFDLEIDENDHLAKFDCRQAGHNLIFEGDKIYVKIKGKKCGLQWNPTRGDVATLGDNERLAKWDCGGVADPVRFKVTGNLDLRIPTAADKKLDFTCKPELYDIPIPWNRDANPHIDGCSNPNSDDVAESYRKTFNRACVAHDVCYRAPWQKSSSYPGEKGKDICDDAFLDDLQDICDNTSFTLGFVAQGECHLAARAFYDGVASGYGVDDTGSESFGKAQKHNEGSSPLCKFK